MYTNLLRSKRTAAAGIIALLVIAALLIVVQVAFAAPSGSVQLVSISSNADCSSVTVSVRFTFEDLPDGSGGGMGFDVYDSGGFLGGDGTGGALSGSGSFVASVTVLTAGTSDSSVDIFGGAGIGWDGGGDGFEFHEVLPCGTTLFFGDGGGSPPPPTAIWLADVCEPFDGFSGDGWTTVDSDAKSKPWGTKLYVAASAAGPWFETEFLQPPYIISQSQMDALAAMIGAATPADVWMRAGDNGTSANYGSMVQDRNANMDELCGL